MPPDLGKSVSAGVTKWRLYRSGDYSGSSKWAVNAGTKFEMGGAVGDLPHREEGRGQMGADMGVGSQQPRGVGRGGRPVLPAPKTPPGAWPCWMWGGCWPAEL